jgi:hypothetical protein
MFRINCNGTVLVLDGPGLFDLLHDIKALMRDAVIVPCKRGYVVDSLRGSQSVLVTVDECHPTVQAGAA